MVGVGVPEFEVEVPGNLFNALKDYFHRAPRLLAYAQATAVNKTATATKGRIVKMIAKPEGLINVAQKEVRKVMRIVRRANYIYPLAQIHLKGEAIPIAKFGARKRKVGVSAQVFKGGQRFVIPHAFMVKKKVGLKKGGGDKFAKLVLKRKKKKKAYPTKTVWGPAITDVFDFSLQTATAIYSWSQDRLIYEIASQIDYRLGLKHGTTIRAGFKNIPADIKPWMYISGGRYRRNWGETRVGIKTGRRR